MLIYCYSRLRQPELELGWSFPKTKKDPGLLQDQILELGLELQKDFYSSLELSQIDAVNPNQMWVTSASPVGPRDWHWSQFQDDAVPDGLLEQMKNEIV